MPVMQTATLPIIETFCRAALLSLIRAEMQERVPFRFTGVGPKVWKIFRNELTPADLLVLAIQDAAANMPIPFDPQRWLPAETASAFTWSALQISPEAVETWLPDAQQQAGLPLDDYLRLQAQILNQPLPAEVALEQIPTPQKYERWLELPGAGGWAAYTLCSRPGQELYLWENFTILCTKPREMILAGLIAWELGAPPNLALPIFMQDNDLSGVMNGVNESGHTFHAVVGKRSEHGHRDLRFLHQETKHPLWF